MGSKISKQKQLFSLLNAKFSGLGEVPVVKDSSPSTPPEDFYDGYSSHLLSKVYNFYKSLIQNLNSGLIASDLNGEITFVNQTAAKMLLYDRQELLGRNIRNLFASDEESQKCLRAIFMPNKRLNEKEVNFILKNGSPIVVGLNSSQLHDENNNFEGIILLFRDLTEIRHLKVQIERMEKLALLGELSAGIAHEIRNPLAGIRAAAQLLQENNHHDAFQVQIIERIIREVDKANKLLKEFFKFARPAKPNLNFHDIELIIDGVYLLLAPQFRKKNIVFSTEFGNDISQVYVDDTQIEQVLINLFLNAIDAMPEGGKLTVKTYNKTIHLMNSKASNLEIDHNELLYVYVEIIDTGCGIPGQNMEKIFNPFFTTKTHGLGLGLPICSRLVSENHGNLDLESKVGEGTKITLALPAFVHHLR